MMNKSFTECEKFRSLFFEFQHLLPCVEDKFLRYKNENRQLLQQINEFQDSADNTQNQSYLQEALDELQIIKQEKHQMSLR